MLMKVMLYRYSTGPHLTDLNNLFVLTSAKLFMPYTTLLRPVLLYLMSPDMRDSANHLGVTVLRSYTVWALTVSFLVVASLISTAFFQNAPENAEFEQGLGRAFHDFRASFLSMFIFICTAANFADIVDPAVNVHWVYMLYFWLLSFVVRSLTFVHSEPLQLPHIPCIAFL